MDFEVSNMTYEQAAAKLEEIVNRLGSANESLEEMVCLYEQGILLSNHCTRLLNGYEARLEKVSKQSLLREDDSEDGNESDDL